MYYTRVLTDDDFTALRAIRAVVADSNHPGKATLISALDGVVTPDPESPAAIRFTNTFYPGHEVSVGAGEGLVLRLVQLLQRWRIMSDYGNTSPRADTQQILREHYGAARVPDASPRSGAIWLRRDGVSPDGSRLRVLVETADRGWVIAIDVPWPGGEGDISHIVEPRAIPDCPVDPVTRKEP